MAMPLIASIKADVKFLTLQFGTPAEEYIACLKAHPEVVVICVSIIRTVWATSVHWFTR